MTRRLLVVEDHDATRKAMVAIFGRLGWDASGASCVAEAVKILTKDAPPDCAVVDLMLPDGDGEDVIRAIRARDLPTCIAVCTGSADHRRLDALRQLDIQAVLRKPIRVEDVAAACDDLKRG